MEARKWEDLPMDYLLDIFGRVGVESLLFDVPLVCKSWYKATLSPFCWEELLFPNTFARGRSRIRHNKDALTKFVEACVHRSAGGATVVDLPYCYTNQAMVICVAENCPALKKLLLESEELLEALSLVIGKFKNLELLDIFGCLRFKDIVTEISVHCENFVALIVFGAFGYSGFFGEEEVMALVTFLPKLKFFKLRNVWLKRDSLIKILKGCVELVHLDISDDGLYYDVADEELCKLASHIPKFEWAGTFYCSSESSYDSYESGNNSD